MARLRHDRHVPDLGVWFQEMLGREGVRGAAKDEGGCILQRKGGEWSEVRGSYRIGIGIIVRFLPFLALTWQRYQKCQILRVLVWVE